MKTYDAQAAEHRRKLKIYSMAQGKNDEFLLHFRILQDVHVFLTVQTSPKE